MNYTRHFIVEGRHLGAVVARPVFTHGQLTAPLSYAYLCPVCGDVWAKAPVEEPASAATTNWQSLAASCRKHSAHSLAVPGSLSISWQPEYDSNFPDEVVRWEFQRHLDYYTKGETQ